MSKIWLRMWHTVGIQVSISESKILNEQREVIESLHKTPVDIINENPHQLVSDWDMLAFLNVITRIRGWTNDEPDTFLKNKIKSFYDWNSFIERFIRLIYFLFRFEVFVDIPYLRSIQRVQQNQMHWNENFFMYSKSSQSS